MITKKYNLINNIGGWFVFAIALITYWLTLEPTASYWDCGEFIIQADKLEVGHPPGNPIFMLTARFFANFAPSVEKISVMVNAMSGLLSALTILLLFWTISHLVRRLVVKDTQRKELTLQKYIIIMGSALVGSLAYCWSDTFWFSAVEGEVYAFSSFCTALVFWLIIKWENRINQPHSDRYLVLIAYIIGVSVAVHLLNLLCIPAIVLVFVYRKWPGTKLIGSLVALAVSFGIIVLVLYGLVPGFIKVAQIVELIFVNGFHLGFNSGALAYVILMICSILWAIYEIRKQKNAKLIRLSFLTVVTLSGMLFIGNGLVLGILLSVALIALLWYGFKRNLPVRVLGVIIYSIGVIFIGYSSYALIIIRSTADTPMNQNSPDNVFDLAAYLNREQYGETPLLYGETLFSEPQYMSNGNPRVKDGYSKYMKGVHNAPMGQKTYGKVTFPNHKEIVKAQALDQRGGDFYVVYDHDIKIVNNPELDMVFPRLYSGAHASSYLNWVDMDYSNPEQLEEITVYDPDTKENLSFTMFGREPEFRFKPSFGQNLAYFFNYQLNHMYMRYFLWNFVGRQNDITNQRGELDAGNWISGIPAIDNARLGDQDLLPDDLGKNNAGNNKYYFLPLLLGLIGLIWQSSAGRRGIEQFWIVFFLFFMTGIAIVLYLNQTPDQPRERDYAFAGSFYAFAIWIGMGVAGLWRLFMYFVKEKVSVKINPENAEEPAPLTPEALEKDEEHEQNPNLTDDKPVFAKASLIASAVALALGIFVPLQMVSQTWDDHDRSDRYAARDYAINYLESLEPNAIIFCNGDNDTFPLWYAQEVEGVRPDVKIVNLSYLNSEWYANQHRMQSYSAKPISFTATPEDLAYGKLNVAYINNEADPADMLQTLKKLYADVRNNPNDVPTIASRYLTIPVNKEEMVKKGLVAPADTARMEDRIIIDIASRSDGNPRNLRSRLTIGEILMLDIIATNAANGWTRPIYWASTVGDDYHIGLTDYLRSTGMTYQLVPTMQYDKAPRTDRAYDVVTKKYRWGIGQNGEATPYFDETARRMYYGMRRSMVDLASQLYAEGLEYKDTGNESMAKTSFDKAINILQLLESKLPERVAPLDSGLGQEVGVLYCRLGEATGNNTLKQKGLTLLKNLLEKYTKNLNYYYHIANTFVSPRMTYENQVMPIYYYQLADAYLENGGNRKTVDSILKKTSFNFDQLSEYYQQYKSSYSSGAQSEVGNDELLSEILKVIEISNTLEGMTPEEYAKQDNQFKEFDSILYQIINHYLSEGGTQEALEKSEAYKNLNMDRSKRLYEEYQKNHQ